MGIVGGRVTTTMRHKWLPVVSSRTSAWQITLPPSSPVPAQVISQEAEDNAEYFITRYIVQYVTP